MPSISLHATIEGPTIAAKSVFRFPGTTVQAFYLYSIVLAIGLIDLSATASPHLLADDTTSLVPAFDREVRPVLQKCIGCHGPDRPKADLCLTNRSSAIELEAIVPHDPNSSSLMERVLSSDPDYRMPPDEPLSESEVSVLRRWIASGAEWPRHWSYRILSKPNLPPVDDSMKQWCENPVDRFIAARLEQSGLTPSARADRRTLLRRLYIDLTGMPPTSEEVLRFQNDVRPDAYQRTVDSLLASPQYGERWARHWMDIVHFAETHGHDQDRPREYAWPYRDYLIRRFNEDVSYSLFIREQIAGDTFYPGDSWSLVGTGFLAAGPWDESSLMSVQEDSIDREIGRYLDRDDIVTTVLSTFASTSIHCARCHHHKFDPITQDEYYGLQAVFSGIDKANRKYDQDVSIAIQRQALCDQLRQIDSWTASDSPIVLSDEYLRTVAEWEELKRGEIASWTTMLPVDFTSGAGQTLSREVDNSIYVDGYHADKDRYVLNMKSDLREICAIRLAVLADDRLPNNGPGRKENGNFHLNEIRIFELADDETNWQRQIPIAAATSDFEQTDWTVSHAIDGNFNTAWGIHPQAGTTHYAMFEFKPTQSTRFRIELDQVHGAGHVIGHFSLAASNQTVPLKPELPHAIVEILTSDPNRRTVEQRVQLVAHVERERILTELANLPNPSLVYCGTNQFDPDGSFRPAEKPRQVQVLDRGEISKPLYPARATTLSCVEGMETDANKFDSNSESQRRIELANWLASPKNGLVWRSIANRVWHYHFGKALVDTPNDFGNAGSAPTHPELLDWLAAELEQHDGSLKALHRIIVTSATYQQSSNNRVEATQIDAGNRLFWRMNRTRLDAESFRDSLLQLSSSLDSRMGGPSDRQFNQSQGVHVTPIVDYQGFDAND
ncbi:MAG: PSD1 and planctomycete cytochrome C domain-containing protein, partial [Aureliella sp.]